MRTLGTFWPLLLSLYKIPQTKNRTWSLQYFCTYSSHFPIKYLPSMGWMGQVVFGWPLASKGTDK